MAKVRAVEELTGEGVTGGYRRLGGEPTEDTGVKVTGIRVTVRAGPVG